MIGYGWQVDEDAFLNDVQQYVGDKFDDGDILDKEMVKQLIYEGLLNLENFMLDYYKVNYEGENEEVKDLEFIGKLKDCLNKFNISSFKKEWKLEKLVQNWDGYEDYIFNDSESEKSYDDIFGVLNHIYLPSMRRKISKIYIHVAANTFKTIKNTLD